MKKVMGDTNSQRRLLGRQVGPKVAELLTQIEKEPVPERLMDLAVELQHAINRKLDVKE